MVTIRRALPLAVCIAVLGAPSPAGAQDGTFVGKSAQRKDVSVLVQGGKVTRVQVRWRARCGSGRMYTDGIQINAPIRQPTGSSFVDSGPNPAVTIRGFRVRGRLTIRGKRTSASEWTGSLIASAVVRRHRRTVDHCSTGRVKWSAHIHQLALDMTSDAGDYIGGGQAYSFHTSTGYIASGDRQHFRVVMGGWWLSFQAPRGRRLTPGHFTGAVREPFAGPDQVGLEVTAPARGCNEVAGEFTVLSSSFDRHGHARAMRLSFVQHCEGLPPALRGTLSVQL